MASGPPSTTVAIVKVPLSRNQQQLGSFALRTVRALSLGFRGRFASISTFFISKEKGEAHFESGSRNAVLAYTLSSKAVLYLPILRNVNRLAAALLNYNVKIAASHFVLLYLQGCFRKTSTHSRPSLEISLTYNPILA